MLKGFITSHTVIVLMRRNAANITQLKTKMIRRMPWNGLRFSFFIIDISFCCLCLLYAGKRLLVASSNCEV